MRPLGPASELIGPYEVLVKVGSGALGPMHVAYASSGVEEGRLLAIRRVAFVAKEDGARIETAARLASTLRHPRLLATLEALSRASEVALVSEYVEAVSLKSLLERASVTRVPLPTPVALAIATDIVRALRGGFGAWKALTDVEAPPMRGGLTPETVIIPSFGECMLSDFGVSSVVASVPALGLHKDLLPYRSPESLAAKEVDERADVYAVGVLLWEMLANRPLFGDKDRFRRSGGQSTEDTRKQITNGTAPRLDSIARAGPPIPAMLVEVVQQLLATDPASRFPTLESLDSALGKLTAGNVASPEQVAGAAERLARSELEAQRSAIAQVQSSD